MVSTLRLFLGTWDHGAKRIPGNSWCLSKSYHSHNVGEKRASVTISTRNYLSAIPLRRNRFNALSLVVAQVAGLVAEAPYRLPSGDQAGAAHLPLPRWVPRAGVLLSGDREPAARLAEVACGQVVAAGRVLRLCLEGAAGAPLGRAVRGEAP